MSRKSKSTSSSMITNGSNAEISWPRKHTLAINCVATQLDQHRAEKRALLNKLTRRRGLTAAEISEEANRTDMVDKREGTEQRDDVERIVGKKGILNVVQSFTTCWISPNPPTFNVQDMPAHPVTYNQTALTRAHGSGHAMPTSPKLRTLNERCQHNLRLPVSRLPNEILSSIFFDLRRTFVPRYGHGLQCLTSWISVTHVCHAWREIALNTPLLWSHVDVFSSFGPWIPELLRRSKHSPITAIVERHGPIDELVKHFGRVRKLVLNFPDEDALHTIFSSSFNFGNLEALDICRFSVVDQLLSKFVLSDANLGAHRLRTLNLSVCFIDLKSRFLHGLTHLRLECIPNSCALGASDFALVLSTIPALETLYLSNFLQDIEQFKNDKAVKVYLQHLRELSVECQVPALARFLPCLGIPHSCKIKICTWNDYNEICNEFRVILSWVSNQLSIPTTRPLACADTSDGGQYIRTLHFIPGRGMDFGVEGFCHVLSHEQVETADPILTFWVLCNCADENFSFNLQSFFSLLPLDGVVFMDAVTNFEGYLTPEFRTVAFGSIETLKTVYLYGKTSEFWNAFAPAGSDIGAKSLPFPALSSITIKDHLLDFQLVVDKLRLRSQLGGTPLQDLHIICNGKQPSAAIINQLGDLVPCIQIVASDDGGSDEDDNE